MRVSVRREEQEVFLPTSVSTVESDHKTDLEVDGIKWQVVRQGSIDTPQAVEHVIHHRRCRRRRRLQ